MKDERQYRILKALIDSDGSLSSAQLAFKTGYSIPTITRYFAADVDSIKTKLTAYTKYGRERFYRITSAGVLLLSERWGEDVEEHTKEY